MSTAHSAPHRPRIAHLIRVLAIPVILFWIALAVILAVVTPPLDTIADQHAVSLSPKGSAAFQSMLNIGKKFQQFDSDSTAMVVLEGQDKLGGPAPTTITTRSSRNSTPITSTCRTCRITGVIR